MMENWRTIEPRDKSVPSWMDQLDDGDLVDILPLPIVCGGYQPVERAQRQMGSPEAWNINLGIADELIDVSLQVFHDEDGHRGVGYGDEPSTLKTRIWRSLLKEFHAFLCTDDERYKQLRESLNEKSQEATLVIVSSISVFLSNYIGVFAGVLVPFCSFLLLAAKNIGVRAFCEMVIAEMPDG